MKSNLFQLYFLLVLKRKTYIILTSTSILLCLMFQYLDFNGYLIQEVALALFELLYIVSTLIAFMFRDIFSVHRVFNLAYMPLVKVPKVELRFALYQLIAFTPWLLSTYFIIYTLFSPFQGALLSIILTLTCFSVILESTRSSVLTASIVWGILFVYTYFGRLAHSALFLSLVLLGVLLAKILVRHCREIQKFKVVHIGRGYYIVLVNPSITLSIVTIAVVLVILVYALKPCGVSIHLSPLTYAIDVNFDVPCPIESFDAIFLYTLKFHSLFTLLSVVTYMLSGISIIGTRYYDAPIWYVFYLRGLRVFKFVLNYVVNYAYGVAVTSIPYVVSSILGFGGLKGLLLIISIAIISCTIVAPCWERGESIGVHLLTMLLIGVVIGVAFLTPLQQVFHFRDEYIELIVLLVSIPISLTTLRMWYTLKPL